jgi:hypothetical protein
MISWIVTPVYGILNLKAALSSEMLISSTRLYGVTTNVKVSG